MGVISTQWRRSAIRLSRTEMQSEKTHLVHSESSLQSMANDVNILCVKYVNMPNTIFKATKAEEEKKISLRVIFRNKKNPPMQTTARKRPA